MIIKKIWINRKYRERHIKLLNLIEKIVNIMNGCVKQQNKGIIMPNSDIHVSGPIWAEPDSYTTEKERYFIRSGNQGWGLPVDKIEPKDLRVLADRIERLRKPKEEHSNENCK